MKVQARVGEDQYQVDISETDGVLTAEIDGRRYEIEASHPEPNVWLLKSEGRVFEAFVSPSDNADGGSDVRVGTNEMDIQIIDPRKLRSSAGTGHNTDGIVEIKTAMPGKIVRVLKAVNDTVDKGEGVVVVEAMKMQNEMRSPRDGVIKSIKFAEGDTVAAGEVLVIIE